jgi:hypothetical protein
MSTYADLERRKKPRIYDPITVSIRGSEEDGSFYRFETIAENIGAGGLCARAPRIMRKGESLSVRIRFALAGSNPAQAPVEVVQATVIRVERDRKTASGCTFAASF